MKTKDSRFLTVAQALLNGLPDGWDIMELKKGDTIHYYDNDDPWYVYAKSSDHYVELGFPHNIEKMSAVMSEQIEIAVENVVSPPDVPRLRRK